MNIINNLFQQYLNQAQSTYGLDSPQYQELKKEQKEAIRVLEKVSEEEQREYLDLMRELGRLVEKGSLTGEEQQKMIDLGQKADNFTEKLKANQLKTQQQQKTNVVLWVCGGLVGLGLIGLVVWLMVRRKKG